MNFRPGHFSIVHLGLCIALLGLSQCQAPSDKDVAECITQCGTDNRCGIPDGCGGSCECATGFECDNSVCVETCAVTCQSGGFECGTLCGEVCGTCNDDERCDNGRCICTPVCGPGSCGQEDGCGGICECEDCGNGTLDPGELCDGNCPATCDDNNSCTSDTQTGTVANCNVECHYVPVTSCTTDDGCCPEGCDSVSDNDCPAICGNGLLETGETCDSNCPSDCDDQNACTADNLSGSDSTCNAACSSIDIITCDLGDGCCAPGCNSLNDDDCAPACANNIVEAGETCDGNCPATCDDGLACTENSQTGTPSECNVACVFTNITACTTGDGCCPSECNNTDDGDCNPTCGNGVKEGTEVCDGNCPSACDDSNSCTVDSLSGAANTCDAVCNNVDITSCTNGDGCCASGCNSLNDNDCAPVCQNNLVEGSEICDGNCPTDCADTNACTVDTSTGSADTCDLQCSNAAIESCIDADDCCPSTCTSVTDNDCSASCGNDVVEAQETCDGVGDEPDDCPSSCDDQDTCTVDALTGSAANCTAQCSNITISACTSGDGCCAAGCNSLNDDDCSPVCDNDIVEAGETCDGNCPAACEDNIACTTNTSSGSSATCDMSCSFDAISACHSDDDCCPGSCNSLTDNDCATACGNNLLEAGELCDGNCPIACVDDGDVCTAEILSGSAGTCNASCSSQAITQCIDSDGCCAPGCNNLNDSDCAPVCGNSVVETGEYCEGGSCPTYCFDLDHCTSDTLVGSASECTAHCPYTEITQCVDDDDCCAASCNANTDSDCNPMCGNGIVEPGEECDGNCPTGCDDNNICTNDYFTGNAASCTARCSYSNVSWCCNEASDCPGSGLICDNHSCLAGRMGTCSSFIQCTNPLECTTSPTGQTCLEPCDDLYDCQLIEKCYEQTFNIFPGLAGYCFPHLCHPNPPLPAFFDQANYMDSCDVDGVDDGICMGPIDNGGPLVLGVCHPIDGNGEQEATCNPQQEHGDADMCKDGLCRPADGTPGGGQCGSFCSLFDNDFCPTGINGEATACAPVFSTNGVCAPVAGGSTAPKLGEGCEVATGQLVCEDDTLCVPKNLIATNDGICTALCEYDAVAGEAGHCGPNKACTPVNPAWPAVGVCVDVVDCSAGGTFTNEDWCCNTPTDCPDSAMSCVNNQCIGYRQGICSDAAPCEAGLDCIQTLGRGFCQSACSSHDDCRPMELCQDSSGVPGFNGYCFANVCRPEGDDPLNIFQDVEYYAPCHSTGTNDGLCFGPLPGQADPTGACFDTVGQKAQGAACDPMSLRSANDTCHDGLCPPDINTCMSFCTLWNGESCPDEVDGNSSACAPLYGIHGLCTSTDSLNPPQAGDSCTVSFDELVCADGLICVPDGLIEGEPAHCQTICKMDAQAGEAGACTAGICNNFNAWLEVGVCLQ